MPSNAAPVLSGRGRDVQQARDTLAALARGNARKSPAFYWASRLLEDRDLAMLAVAP